MSWRSPAWGVLGIEPTSDQKAIRSAYAARLKAIDSDRDPEAFIALRDAYEQARVEAQWVDQDAEDEDAAQFDDTDARADEDAIAFDADSPGALDALFDDDVTFAPQPYPVPPAPLAPQTVPRGPWAPLGPEDYDARAGALLALFDRPDAPATATPEEAEAMRGHWRVLAADPRLQQMGHFVDVERWIAGILAYHSPFSDPLVQPVSAFFNWMASADEVHQSWDIVFLVQRRRALDFIDALDQPRHPCHAAWNELRTPADEGAKRGKVSRDAVRDLLAVIRRDYPELESGLDADRVALWEKKRLPNWVGTLTWFFLVVVAIQAFNLARCAADQSTLPVPITFSPRLENPRADVDRALETLHGDKLDVATVETRNPGLHKALLDQWLIDRDAGATLSSYTASVHTLLDSRYRDGIAEAPIALQRERQRLALDEIRYVRSHGAAACARSLRGEAFEPRLPPPPALEVRRKALVVRVLLETRPSASPRPAQQRFDVPPDVIDATAKRAGLDRAAALEALRFKGPEAAQCDARVALIETVLALPDKRAAPLLRAM